VPIEGKLCYDSQKNRRRTNYWEEPTETIREPREAKNCNA
jgi:hypothetical protein